MRWHPVPEAECSPARKFNMLGGFGHSPPSHPFPSPAGCPQGAVTGKPTGELAALPPYLRVVRFKGIAVIRRFLADSQLLSHLWSRDRIREQCLPPAPHFCDQGSLLPTSLLYALPPSLSPSRRERTQHRVGIRSRTSPRTWEWGPCSNTPVRLQKPMPQRMRLFQLELRSK